MRRRSITGSPSTSTPWAAATVATCCPSGGSTRTRAPRRPSRSRGGRRARLQPLLPGADGRRVPVALPQDRLGRGVTRFAVGVNYWPAETAMRMWRRFDAGAIEADFRRCAGAGCDTIRIFLLWEDFQPDPGSVDESALAKLRTVADIAAKTAVGLVPTLFTGHMSGVNWYPRWALGPERARRFRTVTGDTPVDRATRDWAEPAGLE